MTIAKQWDRLRRLAGVPFLRIHDLRHAFSSFLVSNGVSLWRALESAVNVASLKISGGDAFAGMAKAAQ